jgi:dephospho-CoA kinase
MLRVGLTGSIGVGKSFVSSVFAELGCHVLDADQTARDVVALDSSGLRDLVAAFGPEILQADGTLNRSALAGIIFADDAKRKKVNSILHPYIIAAQDETIRKWKASDPAGIAVVDAALMIESGGYKRFDKLVVVHCRPDVQVERVMKRNNLTREEAERRIAAQMPQDEKKRFADYLIDTSDGFEAARGETVSVFNQLRDHVHNQ